MDVDDGDFETIRARAPVLRLMTIGGEAHWEEEEKKKAVAVVVVEEKEEEEEEEEKEERALPEQDDNDDDEKKEEPTPLLLTNPTTPNVDPDHLDAYFTHLDAEEAKHQRKSFRFSAVHQEDLTTKFIALDGLFELQGDSPDEDEVGVFGAGSGSGSGEE